MTCHRCRTTTCPGCPVEVDCVRCGTPTDLDHTDDRGRCPGCVEALIAESLADAVVQPEVIRVAVVAATESTRVQCAEVAERFAGLYRDAAARSEIDREVNVAREVTAERIAREIRALGNARATSTLADTLPAPAR